MNALDLKVPPPVLVLLLALAMSIGAAPGPTIQLDAEVRWVAAAAVALLGVAINFAGIAAFRQARTTVSPLKPENASSLVTGGVFRFTRNPMYVGLLLLLVAWAIFLAVPWVLVGPLIFAAYMTRFQIVPEERVLASRFGEQYAQYKASVRRWF